MTENPNEPMLDSNNEDELLNFWGTAPDLAQDFGVGVPNDGVCLKCQFREQDEIYGGINGLFSSLYFSKEIAARWTRGKQPRVIPPRLLNFLIYQNEFSEEHVEHVSEVMEPGIVVMGAVVVEEVPMLFAFLIDGTHRAVAAVRRKRDYTAYILTAKETMICSEATNEAIRKGKGGVLIDPTARQ